MSQKKSVKKPAAAPTSSAGSPSKSPRDRTATGPMDVALLEQLVKLMAANDLNTVDLRDGDQRVVLRRGAVMAAAATAPAAPYAPPPAAAAPSSAPPAVAEDAGTVAIKSPMVGTFYAKPSPEAKPFVSVGSVIDDDSDVCVIEAMKVFNNIKAETKGTVTKVLAEDGKPVEFGQVLFLVKP